MAETFYKGEEQILYLVVGGVDCPIACLQDNGFSETVDMLETTTSDNEGWKTSRPQNQSFNINFTGVQIITDETTPTRYSLDTLRVLKRARTRIDWKIKVDGVFEQTGEGYIVNLSENAPQGDYLTFDGTIEGYGEPTIVDIADTTYQYEEGDTYIFED